MGRIFWENVVGWICIVILIAVLVIFLPFMAIKTCRSKAEPERPAIVESVSGDEIVVCPDCNKFTLKENLLIKSNDDQELKVRCPRCKQVLDMSIDNSMLHKMQENQ